MPLDCPRCPDTTLEERRVVPTGGGAAASVHVCARCKGVWLDGHTLAGICPTLSHLPDHRDEIALLGREGQGIDRCLRCAVAPFEYDVLGVAIDFCLRCHGVWLDGDEYEESLFDGAADTNAEARGGPYRQSASAMTGKEPRCAYCNDLVEPRRTFMREHGMACARCHYARERAEADARAVEPMFDRRRSLLEEVARGVLDLLSKP